MKKSYLFFVGLFLCFTANSQISQIDDSLMYGGRIQAHAKNASCVLVATNGGIFRTTDEGQSWTNATQSFDPSTVSCNQIVSIGNNFFARSNSSYGSGIYKSGNNGGDWSPLSFSSWSPMTMGKLSNTLYVVGSNWSTGEGRLYSSTDGNSWTPKAVIWTNNWQGGNCELLSFNQDKLYLSYNDNLYYTTDGNILTTVSISGLSSSGFSNGDGEVEGDALGNLFFRNNGVIYKYNFAAQIWSDCITGKIPSDYQIMNLSVTDNAIFFTAMPSNGGMIMYKSTDQGGVFTALASTGLAVPMIENIIEVAANEFIGNGLYEDILLTSNGGDSWTSNANQYIATFAGCLTRTGNSLLFNRGNRGFILSGNSGANWAQANNGIPGFGGIAYFVNQLTQVKDTLFSFLRPDPFSEDVALYKSSNIGTTWTSCPIPAPYNAGKDYAFAGKCDSLLFVNYFDTSNSNYALIVSSTNGNSWVKPNSQNSNKRIFLKGSKNCLFAFYANDNDWDDVDNVYKANSFGLSFTNINTDNLFNSNFLIKRVYNDNGEKADPMMDFDVPNNRALFAIRDRLMGNNVDRLYLYNIILNEWSQVNTAGLPSNYAANCIKYVGNNVWILATNEGLYKSINGGTNWTITHNPSDWQKGMIVNSIQKIGPKVFLGTISNGVWVVDLDIPFKMPNSLSAFFDGVQDRIRVTDATPINSAANPSAYQISGKSITVEAWIYPMSLPKKSNAGVIFSRPYLTPTYREPYSSFELRIDNNWSGNDNPRIQWIISDGNVPGNWGAVVDPNPPVVGAWTHVAATYDGLKVRLYINGSLVSESNYTANIGAGEVGFYIGGITSQYFNGLIDEVRLWNVVRTQSEIQSSMNETLEGNESGLKGYWPMDENYTTSGGILATVDKTSNHNDLAIQYDAKLIPFPQSTPVLIPPTYIRLSNDYALTGELFGEKLSSDGWPIPGISITEKPSGMIFAGDSLFWTPQEIQTGSYSVVAKSDNSSGNIVEQFEVYSEAVRSAQNQLRVDVTHRGKLGAWGMYNKGMVYKSKNGLYAGDFSLVDRDNAKFAGGLYTDTTSFNPIEGFSTLTSRFPGFSAFKTSFKDEREPNRIGVRVNQAVHSSTTAGDDKYVIIEYQVINESGAPIGDLFAQLSADFDIGDAYNNLGGYDPLSQTSYVYETGGATNPYFYGFSLLNAPVSGATFFKNGQDTLYVRSTMPLTIIDQNPTISDEFRNQVSTGPYQLANGESRTFAFAVFAGDDLNDIKNSAMRAKQVYISGTPDIIRDINEASPNGFSLQQNYPNPFNVSTVISFHVANTGKVSLKVFDLQGKEVATLVNEVKSAGTYSATLNAVNIPAGVYFYRLQAENFVDTKKLVLLR